MTLDELVLVIRERALAAELAIVECEASLRDPEGQPRPLSRPPIGVIYQNWLVDHPMKRICFRRQAQDGIRYLWINAVEPSDDFVTFYFRLGVCQSINPSNDTDGADCGTAAFGVALAVQWLIELGPRLPPDSPFRSRRCALESH